MHAENMIVYLQNYVVVLDKKVTRKRERMSIYRWYTSKKGDWGDFL